MSPTEDEEAKALIPFGVLETIESAAHEMGDEGWDMPPVILAAARQTNLQTGEEHPAVGAIQIPQFMYMKYPDPVDLVNNFAGTMKRFAERVRDGDETTSGSIGFSGHNEDGDPVKHEIIGAILLVEAFGATMDEYMKNVAQMPQERREALRAEYGRLPLEKVVPDALESRNVYCLDLNLDVKMIARHRKDGSLHHYGPLSIEEHANTNAVDTAVVAALRNMFEALLAVEAVST